MSEEEEKAIAALVRSIDFIRSQKNVIGEDAVKEKVAEIDAVIKQIKAGRQRHLEGTIKM